ncbi:MAG TPA: hypothetical protein ENI64_05390 [Gammaproteobacteria bacterium]|nr:hypothetical protein [Gammaproteobacteria bacterium]
MKKTGYLKLCSALSVTIILSACYDTSASEPRAEIPANVNHVPSVYLVSINEQYTEQEIKTLLAKYGVSGIKQINKQLYQVMLTKDPGLQRLQELASETPMIRHIQPNNIYRKN